MITLNIIIYSRIFKLKDLLLYRMDRQRVYNLVIIFIKILKKIENYLYLQKTKKSINQLAPFINKNLNNKRLIKKFFLDYKT